MIEVTQSKMLLRAVGIKNLFLLILLLVACVAVFRLNHNANQGINSGSKVAKRSLGETTFHRRHGADELNTLRMTYVPKASFEWRILLNSYGIWPDGVEDIGGSCNVKSQSAHDLMRGVTGGKKKRPPKAIIFGVSKCGSGTLIDFLGLHPDIVPTDVEEAFYFERKYSRNVDSYIDMIPRHHEDQIGLEKTPRYFYYTPCIPERIRAFNESMKLIVTFCNPVKRMISRYVEIAPKESFEQTFRLGYNNDGSAKLNLDHYVLQMGFYHKYLEQWYKYFPKNQIHIVDGDNFVKNPISELKLIEEFLGLPHKIDDSVLRYNPEKRFYCKWINGVEECMGSHKGRKHPTVDESLRRDLWNLFEQPNRELEKLSGRKMSWSFEDVF